MNDESMAFSKQSRGTDAYRAPELLNALDSSNKDEATVSKKSDIWAIGCVLYQLATTNKAKAFPNDFFALNYGRGYDGFHLPQLTLEQNPQLWRPSRWTVEEKNLELTFWEQLNLVLKDCFSACPQDRPSALELGEMFEVMRKGQLRASQIHFRPHEFGGALRWLQLNPLRRRG
jgi:serine/threonine protein kinase